MRPTRNLSAGLPFLLVAAVSVMSAGSLAPSERDTRIAAPVLLCCSSSLGNDICVAAVAAGSAHPGLVQHSSVDKCAAAAAALPNRSGVLLLADGAPATMEQLPQPLLDLLSTKDVRLYVEFAALPAGASIVGLGPWPCPTFTRVVAAPQSPLWTRPGSAVKSLDLFEPNACSYVPYFPNPLASVSAAAPPLPAAATHLVLAKVAGFTTAVFGLNGTDTVPVLTTAPGHPGMLLSSLPMSLVRRGRFSPASSWMALWREILRWLLFNDDTAAPVWTDKIAWRPVVGPAYTASAPLPATVGADSVAASLQWVHTISGLLVTRASLRTATALGLWVQGFAGGGGADSSPVFTGWPTELVPLGGEAAGSGAVGDGSYGIFEAYESTIQPRGGGVGGNLSTQLLRPEIRTDCVGEAAGGLAVGAWKEFADPKATAVAANLLDYLFFNSSAQAAWPRSDPSSSVGGTVLWGTNMLPPHSNTIYADDQGRIIYSALLAGAAMDEPRWERPIMHMLLGNLRLMNSAGYFQASVAADVLVARGWRRFFNDTSHNENNYYQAAGRAVMLLAHRLTGDPLFLERTVAGLASSMVAFYSNQLVCQVGLTSEASRMLLPLAWLVRLDNTTLHRQWAKDVAAVLLARQQRCGAIQELPFGCKDNITGHRKQCNHHPPTTNAEYGTGESTMSQTATDPAADLLYSNNFALHALNEAAVATADTALISAAASLREFVLRTQVVVRADGYASDDVARAIRLQGAWLRSFDFQRWEPYAQASDWAWGPWVAETGHGISLITMTVAIMERNTSMWDVIAASPERRQRFAALDAELKPKYFGRA